MGNTGGVDCARCINILFYSGIPLSRSAQLLMYVYFLTFSPNGDRRADAVLAQQAVFVSRGCFTLYLIFILILGNFVGNNLCVVPKNVNVKRNGTQAVPYEIAEK